MAGTARLLPSGEPRTCQHGMCGAELVEMPDDPMLPPHVRPLICAGCDQVYLLDTETGEMEVDA